MKKTCIILTVQLLLLGCSPKQSPQKQAKPPATTLNLETGKPAELVDNKATMIEPITLVTNVQSVVINETAKTDLGTAIEEMVAVSGTNSETSEAAGSTNDAELSSISLNQNESNSENTNRVIIIKAQNVKETNLFLSDSGYGSRIAPVLSSQNESVTNWRAVFTFEVPRAAHYEIDVIYAAATQRLFNVYINALLVHSNMGEQITGNWASHSAKPERLGVAMLQAGSNSIELCRDGDLAPAIVGLYLKSQ